uniref:Uncharacterized protein n=1 Tax=Chloracidobacterium thermophilum TaxID=458033 RepID=A8DJH3_9BACT|nr:hypothetical protein YS_M60-F11.066 [Chloracidobacterium thermophilum]
MRAGAIINSLFDNQKTASVEFGTPRAAMVNVFCNVHPVALLITFHVQRP